MDRFYIAKLGKTVGLWGDLKLHLDTDFTKQFKIGQKFQSDIGSLTIADINLSRGTIRFYGYETLDSAKKLTNKRLYSTKQDTLKNCNLNDGEHFWFDIIGLIVVDGEERLGKVVDIQRMVGVDYLLIDTDQELVDSGMPKSFMVPYIPRYIIEADISSGRLSTKDTKEILEAS
jgi:16S rRNA processing protein RimM